MSAVPLKAAVGGATQCEPERLQGVRDREFEGWRRPAATAAEQPSADMPELSRPAYRQDIGLRQSARQTLSSGPANADVNTLSAQGLSLLSDGAKTSTHCDKLVRLCIGTRLHSRHHR